MTPTSVNGLPEPYRPLPIRGFNAVGRVIARTRKPPIALDPDSLCRAAMRATRLDDFGDAGHSEGLERLCTSLDEDAGLHLFGRYFAKRQVVELLEHRLRLIDYRKRHPEVNDQQIRRPIFITGLPRTGTTLLHGLLSRDPAHRSPRSWEVDAPCPPARAETYETDPRIERTEKRFAQLQQLAPTFQAIHPIGSTMPQECIVLTAPEFLSLRFEMCFDVAGYQTWMLEQSMRPAYRFHRQFLQHMQSQFSAERWVLKSPGHLGPLDALFGEYPDACVIQTHRDPVRVIPSVSSLEYSMRGVSSDELDPARQGRQSLLVWPRLLEEGMRFRRDHPERAGQIFDLHMKDLVADPVGSVRGIYERFGLPLSHETESRMRDYVAAHPKGEYGEHRYNLEAFSLDEAAIRDAVKGYSEHFGVEPEPFGEN